MKKLFVHLMLSAMVVVGFQQNVQAAMIGTAQVAATEAGTQARARLATELQRADVQAALERNGIAPDAAQARVAALSDAEAESLVKQVDSLPAGGDGIVGALVFVFVLLLVTDILGLTKVYPFTRSVR
ncbi:PA2779 family protein [Pseudoduganella sp. DS3]|uniref:PA2779 family protein n=1 Tax=Pseudoduganella guangdongensis TaxID=2692179 RepID=A0A6N9HB65_9BURK|nr:PA2779 family protein [Pseudoduganella guangdongensis]MYN00700.1 PA2779 family protein [Pseudoduganella guangdongensis]